MGKNKNQKKGGGRKGDARKNGDKSRRPKSEKGEENLEVAVETLPLVADRVEEPSETPEEEPHVSPEVQINLDSVQTAVSWTQVSEQADAVESNISLRTLSFTSEQVSEKAEAVESQNSLGALSLTPERISEQADAVESNYSLRTNCVTPDRVFEQAHSVGSINVLTALSLTPEKVYEQADAVESQSETATFSFRSDEIEENSYDIGMEEADEVNFEPVDMRVRRSSLHSDTETPHVSSIEEDWFYSKAWCKKSEDIDYSRAVLMDSYDKNFHEFLCAVDPEFRFVARIGPCETFDSEGVTQLFEKMKGIEFKNAWPFSHPISVQPDEFRTLFSEIMESIKMCLKVACAERGYEYMSGNRQIQKISSVWGTHLGNPSESNIDPVAELKTILAIMKEVKEAMQEIDYTDVRFWADVEDICEVVLPALEAFDTQVLSEKRINDSLSTITGRREHGFEITESEVDEMLEKSLAEEGFGDFPMTALHHLDCFTTIKQLRMILPELPNMSTCTDIRVKQSGMQAIANIMRIISPDQAMELLEEFEGKGKLSFEKMFGFDTSTFDPLKGGLKRTHYLKVFHIVMSTSSPSEASYFTSSQLIPALLCFYLIFDAVEINTIIYKIICCNPRFSDESTINLEHDRQYLVKALRALPYPLRERLQIGQEFLESPVTESESSMYHQVKLAMKAQRDDFAQQVSQSLNARLLSFEQIIRMCMSLIAKGENQKMAVNTIQLLRRKDFKLYPLSTELFEDLVILALSKYTIPESGTNEKKYTFIEDMLKIVEDCKIESKLKLDEDKIVEKWMNMSMNWFSVVYLSVKFPTLNFPSLQDKIKFPWLSSEVWDEESKEEPDIKKYVLLAKVSTAWPECSSLRVIKETVKRHVPESISRLELYQEMKAYVDTFSIEDTWKTNLVNKYAELIERSGKTDQEDSQKEEDLISEQEQVVTKKPSTDTLGHEDFCMEYTQEDWDRLPQPVKDEVLRQREVRKQLKEEEEKSSSIELDTDFIFLP